MRLPLVLSYAKKEKKHGNREMESRAGGIGGRRGLRATARTAGKQHF